AADARAAGRGEIDRVIQPLVLGELLQLLGDDAGLADYGAVDRIEIEHLVHIVEGDDDFALRGDSAARQPGAAARRHDRTVFGVGEFDASLHLLDAAREHDGGRSRREGAGPVATEGLQIIGLGAHIFRADNGSQGLEYAITQHGGGGGHGNLYEDDRKPKNWGQIEAADR